MGQCFECHGPVEPYRAEWTVTCGDCAASGCGIDWADIERGVRCDSYDCARPTRDTGDGHEG